MVEKPKKDTCPRNCSTVVMHILLCETLPRQSVISGGAQPGSQDASRQRASPEVEGGGCGGVGPQPAARSPPWAAYWPRGTPPLAPRGVRAARHGAGHTPEARTGRHPAFPSFPASEVSCHPAWDDKKRRNVKQGLSGKKNEANQTRQILRPCAPTYGQPKTQQNGNIHTTETKWNRNESCAAAIFAQEIRMATPRTSNSF